MLFSLIIGCEDGTPSQTPREAVPIKPGPGEVHTGSLAPDRSSPHVKLRRNKDDTYTWEISGSDVEAIVEADRKLREATGGSGKNRKK